MNLQLRHHHSTAYLHGLPQHPVLTNGDGSVLVGACYEHDAWAFLLYPENLSPHFFDLSSTEAGHVLQKLANYRVVLAVVCPVNHPMSSQFSSILTETKRTGLFGLFTDETAALDWLDTAAQAIHAS
jgi:hypothetical protein